MIYKPPKNDDEAVKNIKQYMTAVTRFSEEGTLRWKQGKDCYRQSCATTTAMSLALLSMTRAPLSKLTSCLQFMPTNPVFGKVGQGIKQHCYGGDLPPNFLVDFACFFIHAKSVESMESPAWFHLSSGLLWALHNTDLKHVTAKHVNMPFQSFFFSIPSNVFYLEDKKTGLHQARYMGIAEDWHEPWGKGVSISIHGEPNKNSVDLFDDHRATLWIPLFDENIPLEMLINFNRYKAEVIYDLWDQVTESNEHGLTRYKEEASIAVAKEVVRRMIANEPFKGDRGIPFQTKYRDFSEEERVKISGDKPRNAGEQSGADPEEFTIFGKKYTGYDRWSALSAIVINALLYINSVSVYKKHVHADQVDDLKEKCAKLNKKKGKALIKSSGLQKIRALSAINEWFIGTDIIINPEEPTRETIADMGQNHTLRFPSITRGHWRHQAHGPRHSLRKLIWIAPFIRGKQLGSPSGHNYHVKP